MEIEQNLGVQRHTKKSNILQPMDKIFVSEFQYNQTALNIMKLTHVFAMFKNIYTTEQGMNVINNLSTGQTAHAQRNLGV